MKRSSARSIAVRLILVFLFARAPLIAGSSHAQEAAPKSFFKKDYASAPGAAGRDAEQRAPSVAKSGTQRSVNTDVPGHPLRTRGSPHSHKRKISMSVYVNSVDKEHFTRVIQEVLALHDEKRAFIFSLEQIGDYQNVTPEIENELARRNIHRLASSGPPLASGITQSPAWIIQTQQGTHIAEGIIEVHSLLNEYGEYDPKQHTDPNSKMNVEGF